jgi:hypothetical protein
MRPCSKHTRLILCLMIPFCILGITFAAVSAQSQEPKPAQESATPAASEATPVESTVASGLANDEWLSPIWGIHVAWNPDDWSVENELIDGRYEGLQLGSNGSSVYIEAYEGFNGSAQECLVAAEQEITERTNTREVNRLSGRPLPELPDDLTESILFGVVADLPDGTIYRGTEHVACRSLEPGVAVLETTWQTTTTSYNDELSGVSELFASLTVPDNQTS